MGCKGWIFSNERNSQIPYPIKKVRYSEPFLFQLYHQQTEVYLTGIGLIHHTMSHLATY